MLTDHYSFQSGGKVLKAAVVDLKSGFGKCLDVVIIKCAFFGLL